MPSPIMYTGCWAAGSVRPDGRRWGADPSLTPSGSWPVSLMCPAWDRIFKEARKDKGQDDFLGNVVLRLQVSVGEKRPRREAEGGS